MGKLSDSEKEEITQGGTEPGAVTPAAGHIYWQQSDMPQLRVLQATDRINSLWEVQAL